jgi:hypothetical protein
MLSSPHRRALVLGLCCALAAPIACAADPVPAAPVNYLQAPVNIALGGVSYTLAWSSRPDAVYTKHEYLPKGQTVKHYGQMLMLERLEKGSTVTDIAAGTVRRIEARKGRDPMAQVEVLRHEKTKETIVNFLMSEGDVVEWNAYRYAATPSGRGVVLVGISKRGYRSGKPDAVEFLKELKQRRTQWITELAQIPFPATTEVR